MNTSRKGTLAELRTAALLEQQGWVVASRRHMSGPGDLLAVKLGERPRLIEVKSRVNLWQGFRREDRDAMRKLATRECMDAQVAWWRPRARTPVFLGVDDWPNGGTDEPDGLSYRAA